MMLLMHKVVNTGTVHRLH